MTFNVKTARPFGWHQVTIYLPQIDHILTMYIRCTCIDRIFSVYTHLLLAPGLRVQRLASWFGFTVQCFGVVL